MPGSERRGPIARGPMLFGIGFALLLGSRLRADGPLSLNGEWEARPGKLDEVPASLPGSQGWSPVKVPSREWPGKALNDAPAVWVRRTVEIPEEMAGRDGVLRWGRVHWGLSARVNGIPVGASPVTCPHDAVLPPGLLRPGPNEILLRVGGWSGVPKRDGVPLVPGGYPDFGGPRPGGILGDMELDLYRRAHLSEVLMMPDVAGGRVRARIRIRGVGALGGDATLSAHVLAWRPGGGAGDALGEAESRIDLSRAPGPYEIDVPLRGAKLWSPESPDLCLARVALSDGAGLCHSREVRFGQRELRIVDGRFELNGKRFFMRGENLMWQWFWSDAWYANRKKIEHYLVDFARNMNSKGYRTHTSPPPDSWLDIADEKGMAFLSELPMILNYGRWPFSEEDWLVYERNALLEAEGWVRAQWNRPSVIIWVPTNEFRDRERWQNTTLYDAIKALDPTRPVLRAGETSPDIVDMHSYTGMWDGADGDFHGSVAGRARDRDPRRPLTNTEYLGSWGEDQQLRLNGRVGNDRRSFLVYAGIVSEQTEAMRRLGFDCILPYGCSGASDRADMTSPNYHALRSALAPVAVSIDLLDRNFTPGRKVEADVCLVNDTPEPESVRVECSITSDDPEFLLSPASLEKAVWRTSFEARVPAAGIERRPVEWPLPETAGTYFLSAVLTATGRKPVISQRVIRVIPPTRAREADPRPVLVLGADGELRKWLGARGMRFVEGARPGEAREKPRTVLVWGAGKLRAEDRAAAAELLDLAKEGARLVIAAAGGWDWRELADFTVEETRSSNAFWADGLEPPPDFDREWLRRWNGRSGIIAKGFLKGPFVRTGRALLWVEDPKKPVLVEASQGSGRVVVSLLEFRERLDPESPAHDLGAERLLEHLLRDPRR